MSGRSARETLLVTATGWRVRRLDPDTLAFVLGLESLLVGVVMIINPAFALLTFGRLGLEFAAGPALVGLVGVIVGALLVPRKPHPLKRWALMLSVLYWTFIASSFIVVSPTQPLIATGTAVSSAVTSIIAYWRSWVWR